MFDHHVEHYFFGGDHGSMRYIFCPAGLFAVAAHSRIASHPCGCFTNRKLFPLPGTAETNCTDVSVISLAAELLSPSVFPNSPFFNSKRPGSPSSEPSSFRVSTTIAFSSIL